MKIESRPLSFGILVVLLILATSNACLYLRQEKLEKKILNVKNAPGVVHADTDSLQDCIYDIEDSRVVRVCPKLQETYVSNIGNAGAHPQVGTLVRIAQPDGDKVYFAEGAGEMGGNIWSFDIPSKTFSRTELVYAFGNRMTLSGDQTYLVAPVKGENPAEAKSLRILDLVNAKERIVGQLDPSLSYSKNASDFDGSPVIGKLETSDKGLTIDVFSSKEKMDLLQDRKVLKRITIPLCEINGSCAAKNLYK